MYERGESERISPRGDAGVRFARSFEDDGGVEPRQGVVSDLALGAWNAVIQDLQDYLREALPQAGNFTMPPSNQKVANLLVMPFLANCLQDRHAISAARLSAAEVDKKNG